MGEVMKVGYSIAGAAVLAGGLLWLARKPGPPAGETADRGAGTYESAALRSAPAVTATTRPGTSRSEDTALRKAAPELSGWDRTQRLEAEITDRDERLAFLATFLRRMSVTDPRGALAAALSVTPFADQQHCTLEVLRVWGEREPKLAAEWALLSGSAPVRREALPQILSNWGHIAPTAAAQWAAANLRARSEQSAVARLTRTWARQDHAAAAQWVRANAANPAFRESVGAVATHLATRDPQAAAAWIETLGPQARAAAVPVVEALAAADPRRAAEWTQSINDERTRSIAARSLAELWARSDPAAAAGWVQQQTSGPTRDAALEGIAHVIFRRGPDTAFEWAQQIGDPGARREALLNLGWRWLLKDREAATAWISASNLPPDVKARLGRGQTPR